MAHPGKRALLKGVGSLIAGGIMAPWLGTSPEAAAGESALSATPLAELEKAAEREGTIVLYLLAKFPTWEAGFKKRYPWAKFETFTGAPAEVTSKLITEAATNAPTADVLMMTSAQRKALVTNRVVTPVRVESESRLSANVLDASGYYHPIYLLLAPILYNTNLLKSVPRDIYELAQPEWRNKIAFDKPQNLSISASFLASRRQEWGDKKWRTWLEGLKANNVFITADASAAYQAVLRGERPLAIGSLNDVLAQAPGAPMAASFYDGGVVPFFQNLWLASRARHPNAGKLFLHWILSEEGQRIIAAGGRTPVLNIDTPRSVSKLLPPGATLYNSQNMKDYLNDSEPFVTIFNELWPA